MKSRMMHMPRGQLSARTIWIGLMILGATWLSKIARADDEFSDEQLRFFETTIRPLLVDKCHKCHGGEKQWGQLRLDSRESILKGGESGPAILPGQPDTSLLIRAVRHLDDVASMPPKDKLSEQQIADLVRWVEMGAPFPPSSRTNVRKVRDPQHWSFQPVAAAPAPHTQRADWAQGPWDQFILAKLEEQGLAPAPQAGPDTVLRRLTFDLTGLPPTPEELEEFQQDDRPDAIGRVLDRLLASPAYGERWGRHWLDVARYADSNGLDENVAHGNAWRYRDYVVNAFNRDLPFDQFVVEQLAGDLLPSADDEDRSRHLIATGFLALGPKVLAEVDEAKMEMDIIDEQLDTVGRAFLGLTLGCARCHDHKFDPIETTDYYGLAGVFKSTRTMEHFKKVAKWHENPLPVSVTTAEKVPLTTAIIEKQLQIRELAGPEQTSGTPVGISVEPALAQATPAETASQKRLAELRAEMAQLEQSASEPPTAMGVTEAAVVDVAVHVRGNPLKLGELVPRRVPKVLSMTDAPTFDARHSGRAELAQWLVSPSNPLTSRVIVNRIWRWHFGKGLVRSTDNFGILGDRPSHPELLDTMAVEFVQRGWSIKELHRRILQLSTCQQAIQPTPDSLERDPENRWFGRAEHQRLDAESIRDALLAVSGKLDRALGGSLLTVKNRAYFFDHTSKDLTDYSSRRRSVYLPVVRNNLYDVFQLLDFPDAAVPNGDRAATTIAPQALMMMNSEFVLQCSSDFAASLLEQTERSESGRITAAYLRAFGRRPTEAEIVTSEKSLQDLAQAFDQETGSSGDSHRQAWASFCHVLLSSNEFIYAR